MFLRNRVRTLKAQLTFIAALAMSMTGAHAAELAVFSSAHCPYCVAWEQEIGRNYAATEEGQKAPPRRLNADARRPADLARISEVEVTPTFVLIDNGHEIGRIVGYDGKKAFWADMHKLLSKIHPQG